MHLVVTIVAIWKCNWNGRHRASRSQNNIHTHTKKGMSDEFGFDSFRLEIPYSFNVGGGIPLLLLLIYSCREWHSRASEARVIIWVMSHNLKLYPYHIVDYMKTLSISSLRVFFYYLFWFFWLTPRRLFGLLICSSPYYSAPAIYIYV